MSKIQCNICKENFKDLNDLYRHIEKKHEGTIPKNFTTSQFVYSMKTGKVEGSCVICKKSTRWNEATLKYKRFCINPKCKEKYVAEFRKRMIGKHGKIHLLNDPNQQKKMLANRSISGEYIWSDGSKKTYTGSYELEFLKVLDLLLGFPSDDVICPSPHVYHYEHEGVRRFYIPDVFIASLNLEVEVKDGGDNPNTHGKIQAVDKVKEKLKDDVLTSQKTFSYIKVVNKQYDTLFEFLYKKKDLFKLNKEEQPVFILECTTEENIVTESLGKIKLYHASPYKLNKIDPLGFDLGNALQKPGWSTFCWRDLKKANAWAVFQAIRKIKIDLKHEKSDVKIKCYWDMVGYKPMLTEESKKFILDNYSDRKTYVHYLDAPISEVGLGNDSTHDEYTVRCSLKPYKVTELTLNQETLDEYIKIVDSSYYNEFIDLYNKGEFIGKRGLLSLLMTNDYSLNFNNAVEVIGIGMNTGELKPGDDIEAFLKRKNVKINKISPMNRITKSYKKSVTESFIPEEDIVIENSSFYYKNFSQIMKLRVNMINSSASFDVLKKDLSELLKLCKSKEDIIILQKEIKTIETQLKIHTQKEEYLEKPAKEFTLWLNGIFESQISDKLNRMSKPVKEANEEIYHIKSRDNLELNISNWQRKKDSNLLYITGLSGSGKSTFSKEYARNNNAEVLEFDAVTSTLIKGIDNVNTNKIHPIILEYLTTQNLSKLNGFDDKKFNSECRRFLSWLRIRLNKSDCVNTLYVLEGMQIFLCFEPNEFKNKPFILIRTSLVTSWLRTHGRNFKGNKDILSKFKFFIESFGRLEMMHDDDHTLRHLSKELNPTSESFKSPMGQRNPVYILMTYTDTTMAKSIRFFTGDPYSHVSISFDDSLEKMYSFGRKFKDSTMSFIDGESINHGLLGDIKGETKYSLYVTYFDDTQVSVMQSKLDEFKAKSNELKFSFLGLFNVALGKETHKSNEYFCSQFVADVLKAGNSNIIKKDPSLYKPYDFAKYKEFHFVERGTLKNYDPDKVREKVKKITLKVKK